ncbi:flagellin [Pseudobacteriovorax antillogorgiicola]|uniref:Flagellin n=1 Tax=Pseudobacteriovorax antillogorgiicola TaxID=1513793 RepID=A0A1Y6BPH8_9BACT|nr:flagellin [Pseudobacteriovorax antillogorgiicola]TCS53769.1 flagellin [Pseudobacteriovorax antillogorgiicola]SMF22476.1 flagellin [Pseudobacteriovorax antillogorgiicola]
MSDINVNAQKVIRRLGQARRENTDSLEKLSSGKVFTQRDPRPADRALAEGLELKLRGLAASKRNINDAISLLQTADSGFSEITNILVRMKEINVAGATTTLTDKERKFLFIEYEALHDELNRIATSTEFNSIPLLNGNDERTPETLILRVADPLISDLATAESGDINEIRFENLKDIIATTEGLGIRSARELINEDEDFEVEDAREMLEPEDDQFASIYDQALDSISHFRASYGAIQKRLQTAINYNEVVEENISAAKSRIADTDYASEVARMAQSSILMQANTALLSQANFNANLMTSLISRLP